MQRKEFNKNLVEIPSTRKYASVILTTKEFRKGRKRWLKKHPT